MENRGHNTSGQTPQPCAIDKFEQVAVGWPGPDESYPENFFRCVKWCPDGIQAAGQCENRTLQLLDLSGKGSNGDLDEFECVLALQQPAPILDFAWYPWAGSSNPGLHCFVLSVRECPVKLVDATDGKLRASYKIVDHRERQVAPRSLAFNPTTTQLYCGCEDAIEVFDLQQPGFGTKIPTTPSKKSKDGMKGIISSISFCPDYSGLYAASSLSSAVTLFSEATGSEPVLQLDGMNRGITQVKFDPARPHLLFAAQRRSSELLCWDVREPHEVLRRFRRTGERTSQKLLFDTDPAGAWLAAGDEDGFISMFDLCGDSEDPILKFKAHDDAIGSVSFNPLDGSLLTVSGSRHFSASPAVSDDGPSDSDSGTDPCSEVDLLEGDEEERITNSSGTTGIEGLPTSARSVRRPIRLRLPFVRDASIKLWKCRGVPEEATTIQGEALQE